MLLIVRKEIDVVRILLVCVTDSVGSSSCVGSSSSIQMGFRCTLKQYPGDKRLIASAECVLFRDWETQRKIGLSPLERQLNIVNKVSLTCCKAIRPRNVPSPIV